MAFKDPVGAHLHAGIPFRGIVYEDTLISGEALVAVTFHECTFNRVRFEHTDLLQATFVSCRFADCVFDGCNAVRTTWSECTGEGWVIRGGGLFEQCTTVQCRVERLVVEKDGRQCTWCENDAGELRFEGPGLSQYAPTWSNDRIEEIVAPGAAWKYASMVEADLSGWRLSGAVLERCALVRCRAAELDLGDIRFEQCNLYASDLARARVRAAPGSIFSECRLEEADFEGAEADGILVSDAEAPGIVLARSRMSKAMLVRVKARKANFEGAHAPRSVWMESDLTKSNLKRVHAPWASLRGAILEDTELEGAVLHDADLHGVTGDLSAADTARARGSIEWRAERERELRSQAL